MAAGRTSRAEILCCERRRKALRQSRQAGRPGWNYYYCYFGRPYQKLAGSRGPSTPMTAGLLAGPTAGSQLPAPSSQASRPRRDTGLVRRCRCQAGRPLWETGRAPLSTAMISSCHGPRATASTTNGDAAYQGAPPFGSWLQTFPAIGVPCVTDSQTRRTPTSPAVDVISAGSAVLACSRFRIPTRHRDLHRNFFQRRSLQY